MAKLIPPLRGVFPVKCLYGLFEKHGVTGGNGRLQYFFQCRLVFRLLIELQGVEDAIRLQRSIAVGDQFLGRSPVDIEDFLFFPIIGQLILHCCMF